MTQPDTNIVKGDTVNYWRGIKCGEPDGHGKVTILGSIGHTEVAWIEGCRGCIALSHIERIDQ